MQQMKTAKKPVMLKKKNTVRWRRDGSFGAASIFKVLMVGLTISIRF